MPGRGVVTVTVYDVRVYREAGWWMVHIPEIDGLTQARKIAEVESMARDLICIKRDVSPSSFELNIHVDLDTEIQTALHNVHQLRERVNRDQTEAARQIRKLARSLSKDYGLSLKDIGGILGVSTQRAQQLVNAH